MSEGEEHHVKNGDEIDESHKLQLIKNLNKLNWAVAFLKVF